MRKAASPENPAIIDIFDKFLPSAQPEELYEVHLSLSSMLKKSKQTHSSVNIFQIELERQDDGGIILWKKPVRFKHISSGMYLYYSGEQDYGNLENMILDYLGLGKNFNDPNTLFNLIPIAVDNIK